MKQLHRDNKWLLGQLRDSNAALEELHQKAETEQEASIRPSLESLKFFHAILGCFNKALKYLGN